LDATSSPCTSIALGDVDDDGDVDAALACGTAGVVVLDEQGRVHSVNPGAARILHIPLALYLGQPLAQVPGLEAFGSGVLQQFGADKLAAHAPLKRLGDDDDLKGAVLLFASAAGKHITGQILAVDGGVSCVHGGG